MPDLHYSLTDREMDALCAAAARYGMTAEEFAAMATSAVVEQRYVLPKLQGNVVPFEGLKSNKRGTEA